MITKSNIARRIAGIVEPAYEIFHKGPKCYYCGDSAVVMDHCPALTSTFKIGTDEMRKNGVGLFKIASCHECNTLLGAKPLYHPMDRVLFLYGAIQKKHRKALSLPYWEEDELAELDISLRSVLDNAVIVKGWVNRRLEFMEMMHNL